jgi:farnesyl diphosphate synthase
MASSNFADHLTATATDAEALLERLLDGATLLGETARPTRLLAAMRHGALGGGKRLRPFLVVESAALFGVARAGALLAGCALELLHCYSLVHDDLPAMDNDDLRRGHPTVHKKFDDATAILAGDALLTLAFDVITRDEVHADAKVRIALVRELARASGLGGMAGGQMLDLAAEGRFENKRTLSENEIVTLQAMKTGALIRFACDAGALLGEADAQAAAAVARYGAAIGQAFQIADDLLDLIGDEKTTGKSLGTDLEQGKLTLPLLHLLHESPEPLRDRARAALAAEGGARRAVLMGLLDEAGSLAYTRQRALDLSAEARAELQCLPPSPYRTILEAMADRVVHREA